MRSILAVVLALLILAAEAPGLFTESPVCAAVDGRGQVTVPAQTAPARDKSCCGTASCPVHAAGCGTAACPMAEAQTNPAVAPAEARTKAETSGAWLCAPSCGREGARIVPGAPDPGTLDPTHAPATLLDAAGPIEFAHVELPARSPVPADPPPRA